MMKTRIYIGGLGGGVTEDDLKKTFSTPQLGTVESVEINRAKGRSFAYLDIVPSSDKSLPKLFSTYNGCMWKGGRMRLEKAKEHYLARLRREWEQDAAEPASASPGNDVDHATLDASTSEKLKKLPELEKMQLKIFFPKLKKIKPVPMKGTGKHKYSFQRFEAPPLPIHFCDCEEHSSPTNEPKDKSYQVPETENAGINEEELNIMSSVMNKIFRRENPTKPVQSEAGFSTEVHNSKSSVDTLLLGDSQIDTTMDEDNLIMNMVAGGSRGISFFDSHEKDWSTYQNLKFKEPPKKTQQNPKKKIVPNKKRKASLDEEENGDYSSAPARKRKGVLQERSNRKGLIDTQTSESKPAMSRKPTTGDLDNETAMSKVTVSDIAPEDYFKETESGSDDLIVSLVAENEAQKSAQPEETPKIGEYVPCQPIAAYKSAKGAAWLQKSSWTQLVGDSSRSSFSISQILPGTGSEKLDSQLKKGIAKQQNQDEADKSRPTQYVSEPLRKNDNDVTVNDLTGQIDSREKKLNFLVREVLNPEKKPQTGSGHSDSSDPISRNEKRLTPRQPSLSYVSTGETCPFMRTAESMKEWTKAKAALSGSLKKKSNEKKAVGGGDRGD